ncbi:hypothetical protein KGQ19_26705 [Catenulispora sp. NL8]|uniref:Uncharacterized protein n=1 Tax=Catenulispora pinistramenti TaxID=2705254 RepID=A0ABS5KWL2_9ACTN|nr:hypothetical protein [Catenulispora pinistramenti]MBS2550466.1 hypothetical protein [Catenulispora pinistramenti]
MVDDLIPARLPALSDPRAAVQALLSKLLAASTDADVNARDALAFAVHEHALQLREADPTAVTPRMIQAAEMLADGADALSDAARAAREVLDEELTALGGGEISGKAKVLDPVTGEPVKDLVTGEDKEETVYVTGADGTRYRLLRGHTVTKQFNDALIVELIATAARADYRAPAGTPTFLAGQLGDAFEAGAARGAEMARAAIGSGGAWLPSVLGRWAGQLGRAGDTRGAGLLKAAIRNPKIGKKTAARFEPVKPRK